MPVAETPTLAKMIGTFDPDRHGEEVMVTEPVVGAEWMWVLPSNACGKLRLCHAASLNEVWTSSHGTEYKPLSCFSTTPISSRAFTSSCTFL